MAQVKAIEVPDRGGGAAVPGVDELEVSNDLHGQGFAKPRANLQVFKGSRGG